MRIRCKKTHYKQTVCAVEPSCHKGKLQCYQAEVENTQQSSVRRRINWHVIGFNVADTDALKNAWISPNIKIGSGHLSHKVICQKMMRS